MMNSSLRHNSTLMSVLVVNDAHYYRTLASKASYVSFGCGGGLAASAPER